jgi:hypothetical protein
MRAIQNQKNVILALFAALAAVLLTMACASMQEKPDYLGSAESAINQAKALNAEQVAPNDLKLAEQNLREANYHNTFGKQQDAMYSAQKATINAKLAQAKAENVSIDNKVEQLQNNINELHQEVKQPAAGQ